MNPILINNYGLFIAHTALSLPQTSELSMQVKEQCSVQPKGLHITYRSSKRAPSYTKGQSGFPLPFIRYLSPEE